MMTSMALLIFMDGARELRCGRDYKKYERPVQILAGSNLSKLNSGIENMVDDAVKLEKSNM